MNLRDTVTLSPIMTPNELAEYLHIHYSTLHRLIRRGEIPSFKIGSNYRFRLDSVEEWIAKKGRRQQGRSK